MSMDRDLQVAQRSMRRRRVVMGLLVGGTSLAMLGLMARILASDMLTLLDILMLVCFAANLPWLTLGFWNAVVGYCLLRFSKDPLNSVAPLLRPGPETPIQGRTAIVMPVFDEDSERVFRHLNAVATTLAETGEAEKFDLYLLSDSRSEATAAEEARRAAAWSSPGGLCLTYRRRHDNKNHKVGNLWDFIERWGDGYEHMLVLDADSVMSGQRITQMVRTLEANTKLGLLQSLAVGLPNSTPFGRIFQFGMRQGMRVFTNGSAWWQGPDGPYWGHNAVFRLAAFRDFCKLPTLPGRAPLGGDILSHDQVEAAFLRRSGLEVRVEPIEGGSYEENPPSLLEFLKRELRWCQGNLQYGPLLFRRDLRIMSRIQLFLAMLMYLQAPGWILFALFGMIQALGMTSTALFFWSDGGAPGALTLFLASIFMVFSPKIMGVGDLLSSKEQRKAYGGSLQILRSFFSELIFSALMAPVMALGISIFIGKLLLGKGVTWKVQQRDGRALNWREVSARLWPQSLLGLTMTLALAWQIPAALPWAAPMLLSFVLSIPFTVLTSSPVFGAWLTRIGLCTIPEENQARIEVGLAQGRVTTLPQRLPGKVAKQAA